MDQQSRQVKTYFIATSGTVCNRLNSCSLGNWSDRDGVISTTNVLAGCGTQKQS